MVRRPQAVEVSPFYCRYPVGVRLTPGRMPSISYCGQVATWQVYVEGLDGPTQYPMIRCDMHAIEWKSEPGARLRPIEVELPNLAE